MRSAQNSTYNFTFRHTTYDETTHQILLDVARADALRGSRHQHADRLAEDAHGSEQDEHREHEGANRVGDAPLGLHPNDDAGNDDPDALDDVYGTRTHTEMTRCSG